MTFIVLSPSSTLTEHSRLGRFIHVTNAEVDLLPIFGQVYKGGTARPSRPFMGWGGFLYI
ncbi:hypothetical protein N783_20505 [Pontibacillus marinus BH030004 = DSM 16465]|uniref:Uncharacterized protein n=1 Tax=Pontibacillus marinus BH030004 = DSM 16465 TaxID=1385511 RepID=A0A0A5FYQ0_9BACI|nr:hypothetical protein N783_20505 [Pontibacillus marinus BH030004 = DSM 16465]